MKKRDRKDWLKEAWTPFVLADSPPYPRGMAAPQIMLVNSIYQVALWKARCEPFGTYYHLSIKTHDKQPLHDWRHLQRIKNEICGASKWAFEVYPDEAHLVDTANQYHLYVFEDFVPPFGFHDGRLVAEGSYDGGRQRDFPPDAKPADLKKPEEIRGLIRAKGAPVKSPTVKSPTDPYLQGILDGKGTK